MSSTPNNPYLVKSMNGVIIIDDGAGTVIENGVISSNELDVNTLNVATLSTNTINAKYPLTSCEIYGNTTDSYYSQNATGPIYFGLGSSGNINVGAIATQVSNGAVNIATSSEYGGTVNICSQTAINSKIKLSAKIVECSSAPTIGNSVVNKTYADNLTALLLAATNIWTGVSNTFNYVIYTTLISPIGTIFSLGSATNVQTRLQNSSALVVGQTPDSVVAAGLTVNIANNAMRFYNTGGDSMIDFFSSTLVGNNSQSSRIRSVGGTAAQNSGTLALDSGSMTINAGTGTLGLSGRGMAITAITGDLNISATAGVVAIEGLKIDGTNIESIAAATTSNIFANANTATLNIGSSGTVTRSIIGHAKM